MGTHLSWFYDVSALAIMLVFAFIGGKKGVVRSIASFIGCVAGVGIAFAISGEMAKSVYMGTVNPSNINKLEKSLIDNVFVDKFCDELESLDYNLNVNNQKVEAIFDKGTDIDENMYKYINSINGRKVDNDANLRDSLYACYASALEEIIKDDVSVFAKKYAGEITRQHETDFPLLITKLRIKGSKVSAAKEISEKYIAGAYISVIRLSIFAVVIVIAKLIMMFVEKTVFQKSEGETALSRTLGAIMGLCTGALWVVFASALIRLSVIMGSDEMLFFNFKAVDQTIAFKYVYEIISGF